jgi:hypothetical protein
MTTEQESLLKTRLKYGIYALVIITGALAGGYIVDPTWLEAAKIILTSMFA